MPPPMSLYHQINLGMLKVTRKAPAHLRFWRDISKDGPAHPVHGKCWIWKRGTISKGIPYGVISVKHKAVRVHKFSWELHFGKVEGGLYVLHKCDTPLCVNPTHLFLGTDQDNKDDMVQKDRQAKGENAAPSKLTEEQVVEIKRRYKKTSQGHGNGAKLAREFGVTRTAIQYIARGRNWRHV